MHKSSSRGADWTDCTRHLLDLFVCQINPVAEFKELPYVVKTEMTQTPIPLPHRMLVINERRHGLRLELRLRCNDVEMIQFADS